MEPLPCLQTSLAKRLGVILPRLRWGGPYVKPTLILDHYACFGQSPRLFAIEALTHKRIKDSQHFRASAANRFIVNEVPGEDVAGIFACRW